MVVEEVAEAGDDAARRRVVIVRAEDGGEIRVCGEGGPDALEGVRMHSHVGVDEDEHFAGGALRTRVSRTGWPGARRRVDDENFFRRIDGSLDRADAVAEIRGSIGRRYDNR
jgi:hypothetical protein